MSRIDNIKNFAQKREEEAIAKEKALQQRIENYKTQILALKPRIDELIAVGNACLDNNISMECHDTHQDYK